MSKVNLSKIDIVVTQFEAGGAQKAAVNLSNFFVGRGIKVKLIFLYRMANPQFKLDSRVELICLQERVGIIKRILFTPFKLISLWLNSRPDVVVSFTHYSNIYSAFFARLLHIPVVVSHRNPRTSYNKIVRFVDSFLYHTGFYKAVTYVSKSTMETFAYGHSKNHKLSHKAIYNCVDDGFCSINKSLEPNYIVAVGRLTRQKNHRFLLELMRDTSFMGKLYIAGDGPLKCSLNELIQEYGLEERVVFLGVLSNLDVKSLVVNARAFIMPSLYEGMSNALVEAIVLGVHTIVSDVPSQREAVSVGESVYGEVIPLDNKCAWRRSLDHLSEKPSKNQSAHETLVKRYSITRFGEEFLEMAQLVLR